VALSAADLSFPEAVWQRCYVHFLRNALDHLPRKAVDDCLQELRWLYDRRDLAEAEKDLLQWLERWEAKYPKLCQWVDENIGERLTFFMLRVIPPFINSRRIALYRSCKPHNTLAPPSWSISI